MYPGVEGAAHLHEFLANKSTAFDSTFASMTDATTTCALSKDTSGYWIPALLDANGDPVLHHCAGSLAARAETFDWVGYLSTTGVYGDRGGDWVDERSDCTPSTERGRWRLEAEREWLDH